ncbi:MAG: hypothetical protein VCD00_21085 [Candidatus Hydrogenedentota bacterium]
MSNEAKMHPELSRRIEEVADQYRRRQTLRGWMQFGIATFMLTSLFTALQIGVNGDANQTWTLIAVYLIAECIALGVLLIRPMLNPISSRRIALYIDEHHPELENRIISAFDFGTELHEDASSWMIEQLLADTATRLKTKSLDDVVDHRQTVRSAMWLTGFLCFSLAIVGTYREAWVPGAPIRDSVEGSRIRSLPFSVEPGNVRVRRGDNQTVLVRTAQPNLSVKVHWREGNGVWQQVEAAQSSSDKVYFKQFSNVQSDIQYRVELDNRHSDTYQIAMWTPPEVETINLTYHYPEYTQIPSREEPNSGNITALEGSIVDISVVANKPLSRAELVFKSGGTVTLDGLADSTVWEFPLEVLESDKYVVILYDLEGDTSEYNPEYTVAMLRDRAPEIDIDFPRGDNEVTLLEELAFDFSVTDDFGFSEFGIQYEIAGKGPVRISLSTDTTLVKASEGHHEIELDDLNLEVGDFITWTVWAKDTHPSRGEYEDLGDPFFFEIRPFKMLYSEAMSGAGQGGGQQADDLAQGQKDVLIATWNLRRDSKYMDEEEFNEKRGIIVEKQTQLQGMAAEMNAPGAPPEIALLVERMAGSREALNRAGLPDPKKALSEATTQQQVSSRLIAKLKGREAEVQQQKGGGGGGGGSQQPDISDLELARNKNFYEEENATREQQEQTDAVLDRIKELTQRQQNTNEELAKLISEMQLANTEAEKEDVRRKLEKLEEEIRKSLEEADKARQELSSESVSNEQAREAQEALANARHQMQRSLEQLEREELQKARAAGARAMDALQDMQESLKQFSRGMAAKRMAELQEQMEALQKDQAEVLQKTNEGLREHAKPGLKNAEQSDARKEQLLQKKEEMAEKFTTMMEEASELAERGKQTQELMSRKLGDWLRETSKEGILEDIEDSGEFVRYDIWESAIAEELDIAERLNNAQEKLARVANAITDDDLEGMQKALGHLDELLESEEMQMTQAGEQGESGAQGQQPGEQSEQGQGQQPGEESQEGQGQGQSESGQTGQQPGQGEQPGEQGQEGQSGQPGQQPGEGQGQQPGEQPGQGSSPTAGQPNQQGGQQNSRGGNPDGGAARGGGGQDDMMRNFAQDQYRNWIQELRDAESLLPEKSPVRGQITRIREDIEAIRREWKNRKRPPQFDLFLKVAARPLEQAADQLQNEIEKELGEKEFVMVDDGDIPERYQGHVAQYFKGLSEAESAEIIRR